MADYDLPGPFSYLKLISGQIAFLNAQNVEKWFDWHFDIMKHRFIDIT
jgi:hypothetical protein